MSELLAKSIEGIDSERSLEYDESKFQLAGSNEEAPEYEEKQVHHSASESYDEETLEVLHDLDDAVRDVSSCSDSDDETDIANNLDYSDCSEGTPRRRLQMT